MSKVQIDQNDLNRVALVFLAKLTFAFVLLAAAGLVFSLIRNDMLIFYSTLVGVIVVGVLSYFSIKQRIRRTWAVESPSGHYEFSVTDREWNARLDRAESRFEWELIEKRYEVLNCQVLCLTNGTFLVLRNEWLSDAERALIKSKLKRSYGAPFGLS
jgi:hypothetical protein